MSVWPTADPACSRCPGTPELATIIDARPRDLGGFTVGRVLPSAARRLVGSFIFFDHMGPTHFAPGRGIDVRPHPHIGLATVTYLFDGELVHRDSLGSYQRIRPGDVNWMTAGRGIVHSERTGPELRRAGSRMNGLQLWVALPLAHEESEPAFDHHPADTLPSVDGAIICGNERAERGRMLVFATGPEVALRATTDARLVLLGGAPIDGERHIWWNFVSSSEARIEQAKRDWKEGRFPKVLGDEAEFIPLPE